MNSEEFSCIKQVVKTVQLSLPLMYISNEFAGITAILDSWRRQYVKQLQGIVVGYRNVSLTSRYGAVSTQRSYVIYNVKATFDLFCPNIGDIVKGKINRISKEHIGCLIQETINVTIHLRRNSPSGLSKYIYLDREILFEISHFSCEPRAIRVTGDITARCMQLMNDLFADVEEDAVNSPSGNENNTIDREVVRINLSMLNSVKTAKKVEEKSKKRKRESESSVSEAMEESPKKAAVKVEVKTPKKKKRRSLDEHLTDSPGKSPKKIKNLPNNLDDNSATSPEKTPKKKKSKKKKDSIENNVIESPKKEIKSNHQDSSDLDETVELNPEHLNLLDAIKSEVGLPQSPTKNKGSEEKNTKKRKREEEGSPRKKDKKHKKKNKDGSKSKDKKNPSKKKSKVSASGTVLKKDKKKSKDKKDDKSKSSKSKKNRKKDKSEIRKSKKLKLSADDDIKDVIKEIKDE